MPPSSDTPGALAAGSGAVDDRLTKILSSADEFTVASYLNLALDEGPHNESDSGSDDPQQRMAELALQLQLQTQSCHEDIGRIGAEIQAILPRCAADVGRIGVGLDGLRIDAAQLLESTSVESEQEVSSSLETLSTLHALQANLSRTKEILTAAATWDSTLASVTQLLSQQNLTEAVNALAQLENGERALRGMPHREEREEAIAKIRMQVSVLLQPQLKHALANMNTRLAPLQQCVLLYSKLDKMDALKVEYIKNRPAAIHKAWFDYRPSYSTPLEGGSIPGSNTKAESASFLSWLPSWFDVVLSLITEERRQSMAIFGAELVSDIMVKVFRECFRPILNSFRSRLESICSSNTSSSTKGSLESICAVYESTLQFLSLAYESIASGWLDMSETGLVQGNGVDIFNDMASIFLQVTSPFAPYQERLALFEANHCALQMEMVNEDIRNAAGLVSTQGFALETLQNATGQLQGLSTSVFPVAEGAVARFELMNGGYGVTPALFTIDKLMADHGAELATSMGTLSAAMDEKQLAENFDEPHVLCALDALKIAANFSIEMRSVERKTHERLEVLRERMVMHDTQEKVIREATSKSRSGASSTGSTKSAFILSDSMSAVEIDCIITKAVCGGKKDEEISASFDVLQRFSSSNDRGSVSLYPKADEAAKKLVQSCHSYIFDVCSAVPRSYLANMSVMSAWKEGDSDDDFASYGTLPQSYITHVGEHMLALVQALEPFASDSENLALANEVMIGIRNVAEQPWREFVRASGSDVSQSIVQTLMDGKEIAEYVLGEPVMDEDGEEAEEDDEAKKASAAFCNSWLDVVGLAVTGRLLERIMQIPSLSQKGCEHLNADLNYLINVFSALGVSGHPHPLLGHLAELATLDGTVLSERIAARDRNSPAESSLRAIEERLAAMRGMAAGHNHNY